MEQKVIKIGNSYGVIIPKKVLKAINLNLGDAVRLTIESGYLLISAPTKRIPSIDVKFYKWLDRFNKEHKDVLQELARR